MPRAKYLKCYFGCVYDGPLHRFPRCDDQFYERYKQWEAILSPETIARGYKYIFNNVRICYRHFEKYYQLPSHNLTKNAIPTLAYSKVNLHKFPNPDKNKALFNTWVYSIGGDILQLENQMIFKYRRVCRVHFQQKYLCRNNRLTKEAVPTEGMTGAHRFPNPFRFYKAFEAWVHLLGGKLVKHQDFLAYTNKRVCAIHFTEKDYTYNHRLMPTAVPSLHLPECSYHQFPHPEKNPDCFKAWVHIVGGKLDSPADYDLYRKKVICDIHFTDRDKNRNNRLNFLAVPSLHLPGKPDEVCTSEKVLLTSEAVIEESCLPTVKQTLTVLGVRFHVLPSLDRYPERFFKWVEVIGGQLNTPANYAFYRTIRICDRHFTAEDHNRNNRLNALAVPTLFMGARPERASTEKQASTSSSTGDGNSQLCSSATVVTGLDTSVTNTVTTVTNTVTIEKDSAAPSFRIELPTLTRESLPPVSETIDYVDDGASIVEEPMFEFEPNEDFSIENIVTTPVKHTCYVANDIVEDEPPKSEVKRVRPVMRTEVCAERVRATRDTTRHSTATSVPHHIHTAPKETDNYNKYWQSKLSHIVHSTQFCGVCLSTDDDVNSVYDQFEIVVCERSHAATLADILRVVFTETGNLLSNSLICNNCTNKLIQSYMFIQQARETSRVLNCHVNDLYDKSCYLSNITQKEMNQEEPELRNALISLESYDNVDRIYNIYRMEHGKKGEKKSDRPKIKRKFKCLRCNLYLPSYKAWLLHEISTHHRNNKYSTTQSNLSRSNVDSVETTRVLKRLCKICHRTIENGGLKEHMQKHHHGQRSHVCSICNVTFSSFKDFVTHKDEWHYRADSKCLTCLESYSEVELEQHQCRFGCGSCAEVPCVHHKYLMCYREQILNGAIRAKCLECHYVCRTKQALLKHVNLCHLKHRPKAISWNFKL